MAFSAIAYANVIVKERFESWAEGLNFDPEDQLSTLLEDKFGAHEITIVDACPEEGFITLTITSDAWADSREFALLTSGSLAWGD